MKAYKTPKLKKSSIKTNIQYQGERIEEKIERILNNKEPLTDGAPEIYTERKDGVGAAYNIRTDRWEIAAEAMDTISKNIAAQREGKGAEMKVIKNDTKDGKPEPTQGTGGE